MSKSINEVRLLGNFGNDPEKFTTAAGATVARVSLATNRKITASDGTSREEVEWHKLTFWGKLADLVWQYLEKGSRVYIAGRLHYSTSEDAAGNKQFWTEIVCHDLVMLDGAPEGHATQPPIPSGASPFDSQDDALPF